MLRSRYVCRRALSLHRSSCLQAGAVAPRRAYSQSEHGDSTEQHYNERYDTIRANEKAYYPTYGSLQKAEYRTLRVPEFIEAFKGLDGSGVSAEDSSAAAHTCVEGRIHAIRKVSRALYFIDIVQDNVKLQVVANYKAMGVSKDEFVALVAHLSKNDHISVWGFPTRTKAGELSLRANTKLRVVSPFLRQPVERLEHRDKVNANRVLNYLVNPQTRSNLYIKAIIMSSMRSYFARNGFLEVQTPILAGAGTGANAEPFTTQTKALDKLECQMRVAPELWLKKLVISGFDKVFEIGQNFRNEGIDGTHNPEFLSCEFYRSHTDLAKLMAITEDIFHEIFTNLHKQGHVLIPQSLQDVFLRGEFAKYEFIPTLEAKTGAPLPAELTSANLVSYFHEIGVPVPPQNRSPQNLLDTLSGLYLEPLSETADGAGLPVFIYNQPAIMSPLAKSKDIVYSGDRTYDVSLRFELFIQGKEYVNSYEEENSPFEQLKKFQGQVQAKDEFKDNESLIPDWEYVSAMEYGLPPTGGWGCGIDRLAMLFTGSERIEQVLPFGSLKDVIKQ